MILMKLKTDLKTASINMPLSMLTTPLFIQHALYFILRVIEKEVTIVYI